MLIIRIQQGKIDRTIDKYSAFSQGEKGKGHTLLGAIGASNVLVFSPRYTPWDAAFPNANEPKQRIITGHGLGFSL